MRHLIPLCLLAACGGAATAATATDPTTTTTPVVTGPPNVHVSGTSLVDASGRRVRLRGVDHSGAEYACAQGWGIFDGPSDSASVAAIASWKANVVRVPLNEACWLGISGVPAQYGGASYRQAITEYVARLNRAGLAVILDLHWNAPGTTRPLAQVPMPDRDHTPEFWRQVATTFKDNGAVIFDLFNEPYPDSNTDSPEAWRCWRDGGTCRGVEYQAAGMQELVTAVRGTGAPNVILLGGVQYAGTLSKWLTYRPTDPLDNVAASWHVYDFGRCKTRACWDSDAGPIAQQVPLVVGEIGDTSGGTTFVTALMDWLDTKQASYLAWTWNVWGSPLDLIKSYDGTPTVYGQTFRTRFGS
jgi:hypothetical protein